MTTTILLDTMIAGGVFSYIGSNDQTKAKNWMAACYKLTNGVADRAFAIPTPVFFEYASWNEAASHAIEKIRVSKKKNPLFQYIDYSITPDVLFAAARYRARCDGRKILLGDSLIAAYCLVYGYRLVTMNEKDFPRKYFVSEAVVNCPSPDTHYSDRTVMHLLSPKLAEWNV